MKKITFPKLDVELYEEILPNKMKVLVCPNPSADVVKAGVYVDIGSYNHTEKIQSTKTPNGLAYFLSKALERNSLGDMKDVFYQNDAIYSSYVSESYSYYSFKTSKDYLKNIDLLLGMVSNFEVTEKDVELARKEVVKEINNQTKDPEKAILNDLRQNLYIGSPIRNPITGTLDEIKSIHQNTLKKFFTQYYSVENMTLFVFGNVDPNTIGEHLASLKMLNRFGKNDVTPLKYEESYGSSKQTSQVKAVDTKKGTLLSFGIKFLPRQELYTAYKNEVFAMYEVLATYLFSEETKFVDEMKSKEIIDEVVNYGITEACEDTYLYVTYKTRNSSLLKRELYNYVSLWEKKFDKGLFNQITRRYHGRAIMSLGDINTLEENLIRVYANHIAYPNLIDMVKEIRVSDFKLFVKDLSTCPSSVVVYSSEDHR